MKNINSSDLADNPCVSSAIKPIYPCSLAVAYIPRQIADELYSLGQGFVTGTVFPELNKPYKMPFGLVRPSKTDCNPKSVNNKGGCRNE